LELDDGAVARHARVVDVSMHAPCEKRKFTMEGNRLGNDVGRYALKASLVRL
jgi:hypothetical protein